MRRFDGNTKMNKFFNEDEFKLEVSMSREWVEGDNNLEVILYRVDKNAIPENDIYQETKIDSVKYMQPVTLKVLPNLEESTNKSYSEKNSSLRYKEDGDFSFTIYEETLKDQRVDIDYGDYIGYRINETTIRYFEVIDDDKTNFSNNRTILGYRPYYRVIKCKPVTNDLFRGA